MYGEELQCGLHGFSVRDGGFRFDVRAGPYTVNLMGCEAIIYDCLERAKTYLLIAF